MTESQFSSAMAASECCECIRDRIRILFGMVSALVGSYFKISGVSGVKIVVLVVLWFSPFSGSSARRISRVVWRVGSVGALVVVSVFVQSDLNFYSACARWLCVQVWRSFLQAHRTETMVDGLPCASTLGLTQIFPEHQD